MVVNSYRIEFENVNGSFYRCEHTKTSQRAEELLKVHSLELEDRFNLIPSNNRFGTIWESDLKTWRV